MKLSGVILLLILCLNSLNAFADSNTPPLTISRIGTGWGSEGIYISSNEGSMVEGCGTASLRIDSAHVMLDKILSIALSAYHAKSKVEFRVSGCVGNRMNVIAIAILD